MLFYLRVNQAGKNSGKIVEFKKQLQWQKIKGIHLFIQKLHSIICY
jgi:hypothetical protein